MSTRAHAERAASIAATDQHPPLPELLSARSERPFVALARTYGLD
jgi:hypothetical protein